MRLGRYVVMLTLSAVLVAACGPVARNSDVVSNSSSPSKSVEASSSTSAQPSSNPSASNTLASGAVASQLSSLDMVSVRTGWAVDGTKLLRTTDGAQRWVDITPPGASLAHVFASAGLSSSVNSEFLNGSDGWVVANSGGTQLLYRTTNGGQTWATSPTSPVQHSRFAGLFDFVDPTHGWVLVGDGVAMGSEAATIYTTSDGGAQWSLAARASFHKGSQVGTLPLVGDKGGISALDARHAWLSGNSAANGVYLYASADGGRNWKPQVLPLPAAYEAQCCLGVSIPRFFNATAGVLAVSAGSALLTFATADGGASWHLQSTLSTGLPYAAFLIDFADQKDGWVVARAHRNGDVGAPRVERLYRTTNGGQTWTPLAATGTLNTLLHGDARMVTVNFVNANDGWALLATTDQKGRLLQTTDGGVHWSDVAINIVA